jgi:nucleotide-binding universal stress UspA family protein
LFNILEQSGIGEEMSRPVDQIRSKRPAHLVIPLDGSRAAERAVPVVRDLAGELHVPVTVIHVFESVKELAVVAEDNIDWSSRAEPRAHIRPPAAIRGSVEQLRSADLDVEVIGRVGTASEEIIREVTEHDGIWVVMTTLGSSGVKRLLLGSTARAVIRAAVCPVLLVPEGVPREGATNHVASTSRIAVFLDGEQDAEESICSAAAIAEAFNVEIDLVRVAETMVDELDYHDPESEKWDAPARAEVDHYLGTVADACTTFSTPINCVTLSGSPKVQIFRYVEAVNPDIVTLAIRKRSGIERWTYGSLADKLLDTLTVPLLLVPARSEDS